MILADHPFIKKDERSMDQSCVYKRRHIEPDGAEEESIGSSRAQKPGLLKDAVFAAVFNDEASGGRCSKIRSRPERDNFDK